MTCAFDAVAATGAFTESAHGWVFNGALTFDGAAAVLDASTAMALPDTGVIDFSGVAQADSAALAVIIALQRRARAEGKAMKITGLPPSLHSLGVVYGVEQLLD